MPDATSSPEQWRRTDADDMAELEQRIRDAANHAADEAQRVQREDPNWAHRDASGHPDVVAASDALRALLVERDSRLEPDHAEFAARAQQPVWRQLQAHDETVAALGRLKEAGHLSAAEHRRLVGHVAQAAEHTAAHTRRLEKGR